jgi:hypothetical protein
MALGTLLKNYLWWHYTNAYADIFYIWKNYLWFVNHFFSLPLLLRSFASPIMRIEESEVNFFRDPGIFFEHLTINLLMRLLGVLVRAALIACALFFFCLIVLLGLFALFAWTFLPLIVVRLFVIGVTMTFF